MADPNSFELLKFDMPTMVVLFSVILTAIVQLLLCFKVKKTLIKLLPAIALAMATIVLYIIAHNVGGWDAFDYLFFVVLCFGLLVVCGLCWGAWALIKKVNT